MFYVFPITPISHFPFHTAAKPRQEARFLGSAASPVVG